MSKLLHWLIATLMLCLIPLGWYMTGLSNEDPMYYRALDLHQTLGLGMLVFFIAKVAWLVISPSPLLVGTHTKWEHRTAWAVHSLLYTAMFLLPITGYLFSTSQGDPVSIYDLFEIPGVTELSKESADLVITLHMYIAYSGATLIVIHILAAIKHHFIDKDETLIRMTFYSRTTDI